MIPEEPEEGASGFGGEGSASSEEEEGKEFAEEGMAAAAGFDATLDLLERLKTMVVEQRDLGGDRRFAQTLEHELRGAKKMLEKVNAFQNRQTMPRTWSDTDRHTMFYKYTN